MKKTALFSLIVSLFLLIGGQASAAFTVPTPNGFVTDMAEKLSSDQKTNLESKLRQIEDTSHNEIAILITPSLSGDSVDDVAYQVFNTWGVGKKGLDNGVLLLIATSDRKTRIETGKGIGANLTDLQSKTILDDMRPDLRKGDYATALNGAIDKINGTLESRKGQKADLGKGATFNAPIANSSQKADCSVASVGAPSNSKVPTWFWMVFICLGSFVVYWILSDLYTTYMAKRFAEGQTEGTKLFAERQKASAASEMLAKFEDWITTPAVALPEEKPLPTVEPMVAQLMAVPNPEPYYRKYVPRYPQYELFDAPGIPSISPDFQGSTDQLLEEIARSVADSTPSYLNDVLPTVSENHRIGNTLDEVFGEKVPRNDW